MLLGGKARIRLRFALWIVIAHAGWTDKSRVMFHSMAQQGTEVPLWCPNKGRVTTMALRGTVLLFIFFVTVGYVRAQTPLTAEDWIKSGVQSFKLSRYAEAQRSFEQALGLEPKNRSARLYLAATYMTQWVPGADAKENQENYRKAKTEFLRVIEADPGNSRALASLASLAYNSASVLKAQEQQTAFEEARKWNLCLTEIEPHNAQAFYYLGIIAWSRCYPKVMAKRTEVHFDAGQIGPLPEGTAKEQLQETCGAEIQEGLNALRHSLELNPENADAMSYLNLTCRLQANLVGSAGEAQSLIEQAEQWLNQSLAVKRKQAGGHLPEK